MQLGSDDNRRKARDTGPDVEAWLKGANEVAIEVKEIIQGELKVKEGKQ